MRPIFLVAHEPILRAALAQTIQDQSPETLRVVGASGWDSADLATIGALQPAVVVVVVGFEIRRELRAIAAMRGMAPRCRVLVIDTLCDARSREPGDWGEADALLSPEQVLALLVPAIQRLAAGAGSTEREHSRDGRSPPSPA